jgi:DNA invertase Pin-like site-specific DNA recombinase
MLAIVLRDCLQARWLGRWGTRARYLKQRQPLRTGLKRAVAQGKQLGRPRIDAALEKRIQAQLRGGIGMRKIARECGVGTGTVQRIKQEMKVPFAVVAA